MELRAEVKIRNRHEGTETILCTGVEPAQALKWVEFSLKSMDYNDMPEYVIRPIISNIPKRREHKNADIEKPAEVQEP